MLRPHSRLTADQGLEHSWLQVSPGDELTVSQLRQEEVLSEEAVKVLPTGKLKQWVTRRRWQRCSKVRQVKNFLFYHLITSYKL